MELQKTSGPDLISTNKQTNNNNNNREKLPGLSPPSINDNRKRESFEAIYRGRLSCRERFHSVALRGVPLSTSPGTIIASFSGRLDRAVIFESVVHKCRAELH